MFQYDQFTLPNGLRVIAQPMPAFRSVAVGVWLHVGSADETDQTNGYAHFIEHLLFKGTQTRSAQALAQQMDAIGGQVNAFTAKECTCFHAKIMPEHLEKALDLLSDLVLNPKLDPQDIEREKGVVLEEIAMVEDTPEDVVADLAALADFGQTALARPILGPSDNIKNASREALLAYRQRLYTPKNAVIAVAGRYDRAELERLCQHFFGSWQGGTPSARSAYMPVEKRFLYREKTIEQAHLCFGFDGVSMGDLRSYPMAVLNTYLGGGMSSRLFQTVREKLGLAYSVYSYPSNYEQCGVLTLYAGTSVANLPLVAEAIAKEIHDVCQEGASEQMLCKAKEQLRGSYILGQESTNARMMALGRALLTHQPVRSMDQVLALIDAVTVDDVNHVMRLAFDSPMSVALVSPENTIHPEQLEAIVRG